MVRVIIMFSISIPKPKLKKSWTPAWRGLSQSEAVAAFKIRRKYATGNKARNLVLHVLGSLKTR